MSEPICPNCSGPVIVVLRRAWCVKPYADDGCGSYWENWREKPQARQGRLL